MLVHQSEISLVISQKNMLLCPLIWFSSPLCPCKDILPANLQVVRSPDGVKSTYPRASQAVQSVHQQFYLDIHSSKRPENGIGCHGPHQIRMMVEYFLWVSVSCWSANDNTSWLWNQNHCCTLYTQKISYFTDSTLWHYTSALISLLLIAVKNHVYWHTHRQNLKHSTITFTYKPSHNVQQVWYFISMRDA